MSDLAQIEIENDPLLTNLLNSWTTLTGRERQVFCLILRGFSNRQIEQELILSRQTVYNYTVIIRQKIGVQSRSGLLLWAWRHGLVQKNIEPPSQNL